MCEVRNLASNLKNFKLLQTVFDAYKDQRICHYVSKEDEIRLCVEIYKTRNNLTLFDMGFFEPSVMGGGGHEGLPQS